MSLTTDERRRAQSMSALEIANRVRYERAALKNSLRTGSSRLPAVLLDPPEFAAGMSLFELLTSVHGLGKQKARRILNACYLRESKPIGQLTERQRLALMREIG